MLVHETPMAPLERVGGGGVDVGASHASMNKLLHYLGHFKAAREAAPQSHTEGPSALGPKRESARTRSCPQTALEDGSTSSLQGANPL